ncbi:ORF6N domain-containing protein [Daejeonella sp.]|uniref:ORF6N domain-containing protein n=1 Tax=Daejeonella sp. TaxID=2805397 RepID=UPI002730649B|nr:ORF6N domain-containing protein [Daejeonella sp.]MDP2414069.1 ORF6N domain-containing protein [Daejeonella sp.]
MNASNTQTIHDEILISKIYMIREQKVMIDKDLAELYGVKAIRLREQVKRNKTRFPANFMFQLSEQEVENMVSQNAIPSKQALGGTLPYAFTEHGILMLSNVLKNERAIQMSIRIIEIFVRLREMLNIYKDVVILIEQIENKLGKQDQKIELLFSYLNQFIQKEESPRIPIGFKQKL